MLPVDNKAVLITGSDSGIGHALAKHLDNLGFVVFAGVLNKEGPGAEALKRSCSQRLSVLQMDITNPTQIREAYLAVSEKVQNAGLWGIINNAGVLGFTADSELLPMSVYRQCMDVNFFGAVEVSKMFLPLLRKSQGRLVNMSSMAGGVPMPRLSAYGASKAALSMFSGVMRQELSKWGIKVAVVHPSGFRTCIQGTPELWDKQEKHLMENLMPDVKTDYAQPYTINPAIQLRSVAPSLATAKAERGGWSGLSCCKGCYGLRTTPITWASYPRGGQYESAGEQQNIIRDEQLSQLIYPPKSRRVKTDTPAAEFILQLFFAGTMNIQEYFTRISYKGPSENLDLETLTAIFQHHIRAVPFENLSIHCGETIALELEPVYNKIVRRNRGGWCLESNQLLFWVLKTLGFNVTLLGGKAYDPDDKAYADHPNHLLLKVALADKSYILDGGFGAVCQMWEPMELISGKEQSQTPGTFRFLEEKGTWHLEKRKRQAYFTSHSHSKVHLLQTNDYRKVYIFTLEPREIEDFRALNVECQTSPDFVLVRKSICSLQTASGMRSLIGWRYTEIKYNYRENMDLVEATILPDGEVEKTLKDKFNITLDKKLQPVNKGKSSVFHHLARL
ncbi:arylamine N-acetyltransferase, pineal gland isozyme NAT-3 [Alligator mississippiensis]|uniref:arylamine N-acetyltransferase n=1 Tax=Alligator mississippiensis TaxID=8496 RepID=A0A151NM70_ALLMI|nr:arylamine N-acetyltransferase, pineal gland isozyme NAT-3 [Alligator mississippiensis]